MSISTKPSAPTMIERQAGKRTDWLGISIVILSVALSLGIALTVRQIGYLAILFIPATLAFVGAIGFPELGLSAFLIITYAQISNVAIKYHALPSLAQPLAVLLFVVILVRITLYGEKPLGWLRAGVFLLIYASSWLASLLFARDYPAASLTFVGFIKDSLGMLIVVYFIQSPGSLRRVVWALLFAGFIMGTISVFQYMTGDFGNNYFGFGGWEGQVSGAVSRHRMTGPYGNPNAYAQVLVVLAPLALDRIWHERSVVLRMIAAWVLSVVVLTIFFTFSRGGFLTLLFTFSILFVQRRFNFAPLLVTLAFALILIQFLPSTYSDRISSLFQLIPSQNGQVVDQSFRGRQSENTVGWQMFRDHPLIGVGLGNYQVRYQDYSRQLGIDNRRTQRTPASLYLELLSEQGLVGITIFGLLMIYIFRGLIATRYQFAMSGLSDDAFITSAILAGLGGYMFQAIFKNSAYSNVFWVLIGIALGAIQVAQANIEARSGEVIHITRQSA